MSKPKFTPGPWGWCIPDEFFPAVFCNENGNIIADLYDAKNNQIQMVANAALISAAPEMYEELEKHCSLCALRHPECEGCKLCETRKVLNKAKGER